MTYKKLGDSVIKNIQTQRIDPLSHWFFLLKNFMFCFFSLLSLLLGGISFSFLFFVFSDIHVTFFLSLFPFFWAISFFVFFLFSLWGFHATPKGYKIRLHFLFLAQIGISFLLGFCFYFFGISEKTDEQFAQRVPFYKSHEMRKKQIWNNAQEGRIAGILLSDPNEPTFLLEDFQGRQWTVFFSPEEMSRDGEKNVPTFPDGNFVFEVGMRVRILGERKENMRFQAFKIFPLRPDRKNPRNGQQKKLRKSFPQNSLPSPMPWLKNHSE